MPTTGQTLVRATLLDEPKAGRLNIAYSPDGGTLVENPPRFTWLPVLEDEARYCLRVSTDPDFKDAIEYHDIPLNFFTLDAVLEPGTYHWSYAVWSGERVSDWSTTRSFTLDADLPQTPVARRADRYKGVSYAHPRLWMDAEKLGAFKAAVSADNSHCAWDVFFEKSVAPWMERDITPEPVGYPNHKRVAPIWRQTYIDCQELIYAIRHLAIGGHVTGDAAMLDRAKAWLLSVAEWEVSGTTSRGYTDEWAFRVNVALAWGYDWLYDQLSEDERGFVRTALLERTRQTRRSFDQTRENPPLPL